MHVWKISHVVKGTLTWLPMMNGWRFRRTLADGADSPLYCYSVWLRHLVMLNQYGFRIFGARIGELGPGDSLGVGFAALLSGASQYVGLDLMPFAARADLESILTELGALYQRRQPIPDQAELPYVQPLLESYEFPRELIEWKHLEERSAKIRLEIASNLETSELISYRAPWNSVNAIPSGSLDLVFSQAVLEHIDALQESYEAMYRWLKPGGFASHVIDFGAHRVAPTWNGHWAYSDWQWRLVRGGREFLLNRAPLCSHITYAKKVGFQIAAVKRYYDTSGFSLGQLSPRFRFTNAEDMKTRSALVILRKQ
jgi:SAM-dependent methyltransferase